MGNEGIKAPFLPYEKIGQLAEAFIAKYHPSRAIPVPIEDIIDVKLGIDIFPVPGLTTAFSNEGDDGIEAFVNSSLTQITVDKDAYDRQTNRYRFSIAHELGHIQLHANIFSKLIVDSIDQWKEVVRSIPQYEYAWLEWQAHAFAGQLLVPSKELNEQFVFCAAQIREAHLDPNGEAERDAIEKHLGTIFAVSSEVIHRRIEKLHL